VSKPNDEDLAGDEPISEQELQEAEALARALERGAADRTPPEDALEAAALLRIAHRPELSAERKQAVWQNVLAETAATRAKASETKAASSFGWRWLWALVPAAGVGILVLSVQVGSWRDAASMDQAISSREAFAVPPPPQRLLEAQAQFLGDPSKRGAFDEQMAAYREVVLAALEEHH